MDRFERVDYLRKSTGLSDNDASALLGTLSFDDVNRMVENAVGVFSIPFGIATNFVINGKEMLVPMAIEEPSVIAAASKAAKMARSKGGFVAKAGKSLMIGQVQLVSVKGIESAMKKLISKKNKEQILALANTKSRSVKAVDLKVRKVRDASPNKMGSMIIVELIVDTKDAMGANVINTMCESIAPRLVEIAGSGEVVLKILSNYATRRTVTCSAVFDKKDIGGEKVIDRILYAYAMAYSDVYRAVTHNKGVMNGIDAVALATGQDFRAIEAGAHAYASRDGTYRSLTKWYKTKDGDLVGELELPLAVGIVGGITSIHPLAKTALKILGVQNAADLAMVLAAAGLAQNLAAIRALSSEGIQKGHMRLHARNIAAMAGARGKEIDIIAKRIADAGNVTVDAAAQALSSLHK